MEDDEKVMSLVEEAGARGFGIWMAVVFELYRYGNETVAPMPSEKLVRRVAMRMCEPSEDVRRCCDLLASIGLLNEELWAEGKAANEHAAAQILAYWRKVEGGRQTAKARWGEKPQMK